MTTAHFTMSARKPQLFNAILVGGAVAGTFDLLSALLTFGPGVPRAIAGGLLGTGVIRSGGILVWILGVALHYFIAYAAATAYCTASRRLPFLADHWLVCGLFFGVGFYLVMNLVVLPLSALHAAGPYMLRSMLQGLLVHMFLIGLPISFSLHKLAR